MNRLKTLLIACSVAAALGAVASPAGASDARVADGVLRFTAAPGEINDTWIGLDDDGDILVSDIGMAPSAGAGCDASDAVAWCEDVRSLAVSLGDGDDSASIDDAFDLPVRLDGGPGSDYIVTGAGDDTLLVRDGAADTVSCGAGVDTISADPADTVDDDCERVTRADPLVTSGSEREPDPLADPEPGRGTEGSPADSGGTAQRAQRAACATKHSHGWVRCSVRLRDRQTAGRVELTLLGGRQLIARGRGRLVDGEVRLRMRIREPLLGGVYRLRAAVRPTRGTQFTRGFGIVVIPGL